jgi:hypothetical protein
VNPLHDRETDETGPTDRPPGSFYFNANWQLVKVPTEAERATLEGGQRAIFDQEHGLRVSLESKRLEVWGWAREAVAAGDDEVVVRSVLAESVLQCFPDHNDEGSTSSVVVDHLLDAIDRGVRNVPLGRIEGSLVSEEMRDRIDRSREVVGSMLRDGIVGDEILFPEEDE